MTDSGGQLVAETTFSVRYEGPALDDGMMDVRELAPALLALADLFREVNQTANPDMPPVNLSVQATERGSFEIELVLRSIDPTVVHQAIDALTSDPADAVIALKELVIGPSIGLFTLIRWARNRRVTTRPALGPLVLPEAKIEAPAVVYRTADGDELVVPEAVDVAYRRVVVRNLSSEVMAPLRRSGCDAFVARSETRSIIVEQSDVASFNPPPEPEELLLDEEVTSFLSIVSPSFQDGAWRVSEGGAASYTAAMEDEEFLDRIDKGLPFRKGDILQCRMAVEQVRTETGGLSTRRRILEVLQHIPANRPVQHTLFDGDEDEV